MSIRRTCIVMIVLAGCGCSRTTPTPEQLSTTGGPRLLVLVVFDQMRGDYLQRWMDLYEGDGFRRLVSNGMWFTNCQYPYASTMTGCGHASFLTGCSPDRHGIIANEWFDRTTGKMVYCAATDRTEMIRSVPAPQPDVKNKPLPKGGTPERMLAETVADVLKRSSGGASKVVAVSLKDRSAVLPGGQKPDACYWFEDRTGTFVTSTYYRDLVHDWVGAFNATRPADRWFGQAWTRLRTDLDYTARSGPDNVLAESAGVTGKFGKVFPHVYPHNQTKPDKTYFDDVEGSPAGNELLWEFGKTAFEKMELGRDQVTDLFIISFSSNDLVGHAFGPDSHEVLDITLRSDLVVAQMLKYFDEKVGAGQYLLALTADHGICPIPEVSASKGTPAQRLKPEALRMLFEDYLNNKYGQRADEKSKWLDGDSFPWVYLNHRKLAARGLQPATVSAQLVEWLNSQPWVMTAFSRADLDAVTSNSGPIAVRMKKAFHADRSGDLGFVLKPYYLSTEYETGTTHGSPHAYDTWSPLVFFGAGVQPGKSATEVPPQSIAAVFSQAAEIPLPAQIDATVPPEMAKRPEK